MDRSEYDRLKHKTDLEFEEARQRHEKRIEALETVWALCADESTNRYEALSNGRQNGAKGELTAAIRSAIHNRDSTFTIRDIEHQLSDLQPKRPSLASALRRLAESGEIEIVQQGMGRRPTEFKKRD